MQVGGKVVVVFRTGRDCGACSLQRRVRLKTSLEKKLGIGWKLSPRVEILLRALIVLLGGSIATIPCGIEVMIQMPHRNDELAWIVRGILLNIENRPIKLFLGLA